jgi:hypothetical protein
VTPPAGIILYSSSTVLKNCYVLDNTQPFTNAPIGKSVTMKMFNCHVQNLGVIGSGILETIECSHIVFGETILVLKTHFVNTCLYYTPKSEFVLPKSTFLHCFLIIFATVFSFTTILFPDVYKDAYALMFLENPRARRKVRMQYDVVQHIE